MNPSQKEVSSENRDNSTNGGTPSRNLAIIEWNVPNNDPRGVSSEHVYIPTDDGIISRRRVTERTQRGNNAQRGVSLDRGYFALLENNTQGQVSSGNRDRSSGGGTDPPSRNYAVLPCTPPRSNAERGVSSGNRFTSYGGDTDSPSRNYAIFPRNNPQRRVASGNRFGSPDTRTSAACAASKRGTPTSERTASAVCPNPSWRRVASSSASTAVVAAAPDRCQT